MIHLPLIDDRGGYVKQFRIQWERFKTSNHGLLVCWEFYKDVFDVMAKVVLLDSDNGNHVYSMVPLPLSNDRGGM